MRLPYSRKRLLNIVILGSLLGIVVGMAPTLKQRIDEWTGAGGEATEALRNDPQAARVTGGVAQALGDDGSWARSAGNGPEADRRLEQAQILRSELAARERDLAVREELIRRGVVEEFWKRQASAAVAAIALSVLVVLLLARKIIERTGYPEQMRRDESRLRGMQLSVIGALEEFESEVAAARAWASEEARIRTRQSAPTMPPKAPATPAQAATVAEADASANAPAPETVWEAARRALHNANLDEPIGPPPQPAGGREEAIAEPLPEPVWQARSTMAEQPMTLDPPPEQPIAFEAPPEEPVHEYPVPERGPWGDAHRRPGPVPQPVQTAEPPQPVPVGDVPRRQSLRAQVEYLAAEGLSETEIARRLGLSREEVQLAINLSRGNRRISARANDAPVWSNAGGQQG